MEVSTKENASFQRFCIVYLFSVCADLDGIGNEASCLLFRH